MKAAEEPFRGIFEDEDTRDESLNESFTFTPFPEVEPPPSEKKSKKSRSDSKVWSIYSSTFLVYSLKML